MADLVESFKHMHPHQRQQTLALFLAELTPYEWRHVQAAASSHSFQLDLIGRLPLELVAEIFAHLDLVSPYRWQTVSRRWYYVLRSQAVLKASLDPWFQGTLRLQDADYERTAARIHKFRTGRPTSVLKIALDTLMTVPNLRGDHLVWLKSPSSGQPRCACVLNLHTWQLRTLAGEAREQIFSLVASDEIVMLTTYTNTCYVFELHHIRPPKKFKIPSVKSVQYPACRGRTVACAAAYEMHTSVFIWDYDTQRSTSFDISHDFDTLFAGHTLTEVLHIALLIKPETSTVTLLFVAETSDSEPPPPPLFVLATYTLQGEYVTSSRVNVPHEDKLYFRPSGTCFIPADDCNTLFTLGLAVTENGSTPSSVTWYMHLCFNAKTGELSPWDNSLFRDCDLVVLSRMALAWWKDTCYGYDPEADTTSGVMMTCMGTRDKEVRMPIVSEPECTDPISRVPVHKYDLLLNEKYVIRVASGRAYVACFDKNSNRPKANDYFFDMGRVFIM